MRSRTFLHVSLGILALTLAYNLGARSATAQASGTTVVAATYTNNTLNHVQPIAITANGDAFRSDDSGHTWIYRGNVFSGGPTSTSTQESFGSLKARYRGELEPQGVKPSTNR